MREDLSGGFDFYKFAETLDEPLILIFPAEFSNLMVQLVSRLEIIQVIIRGLHYEKTCYRIERGGKSNSFTTQNRTQLHGIFQISEKQRPFLPETDYVNTDRQNEEIICLLI